ncbi:hypothetical protein CKY39_19750 [Variovorax boronicumulans]|uniref:Arc-like DNA binding domain-containing protein n=1 Tax=Variovorax boronicumulans TaxID=436515 RepID=A0A250DLE7_9BURK|nr:Arc family DNA-binding protein [Variovorax boronicumulans]ATA55197.1 hypothetical protein CKY39_19750 [Variovorax boronicumulans]
MATSIDQKDFVKTALRLPPDLHAAVHEAAQKSGRSYNAELVDRVGKSFENDLTVKLLRGNVILLRTLANFVSIRHNHPEVGESLEAPMLDLAKAVKATDDDTKLAAAGAPALTEYINRLIGSVEEVTAILGPGWAKSLPQRDADRRADKTAALPDEVSSVAGGATTPPARKPKPKP